jgi:predicted methyltransferase
VANEDWREALHRNARILLALPDGDIVMKRAAPAVALCCALIASVANAAPAPLPSVLASVDGAARPDEDRARDADRKPSEVMTFAGVKPGMVIVELLPGSGYYTRMLAAAVGPKGEVYAFVPAIVANAVPAALEKVQRLAAGLPNVRVIVGDLNNVNVPEKADIVWTTENYHDLQIAPLADIPAFNRSVFNSLKRGGTFLVEDHSAEEGAAPDVTSKLHRIDENIAKTELAAAGFRIAGESDILRNAADDRQRRSSDPAIRGRTDRFLLRLQKP